MNSLNLSKDEVRPAVAGKKRLESVKEAISWPTGPSQDQPVQTVVYNDSRYKVVLSKPGKEASQDYQRAKYKNGVVGNNPNDMRPEILLDDSKFGTNATFTDIFKEIQVLHSKSRRGLELLGYLLGRSAYMADHFEIRNGIWRYNPPPEAVQELSNCIELIYGVPPIVFLHYLNALALNEDVKYFTLGYDITKDTGRRNNLLTCVNLVCVFMNRVSIVDFAGQFSRPPSGLSPISQKKMREIFPLLNEESFV